MARRPALRALADALGILPAYLPVGARRPLRTRDETRQALLTAMGWAAQDEASAQRSLERLREMHRRRLVAPVQVLRRSARLEVAIEDSVASSARVELAIVPETGEPRELRARLVRGRGRVRLRVTDSRLPLGEHRLELRLRDAGGVRSATQVLFVVPDRCPSPREVCGRERSFGLWCNLYALRTRRDLGVGDLTTLARLTRLAAASGGTFVGLNPLHVLRNRGSDVSPYSPVSRLFRNPLYLDPRALPEWRATPRAARLLEPTARAHGGECGTAPRRLDYPGVMASKLRVLEELHRTFQRLHGDGTTERGRAYARFCRQQGPLLRRFACFQVIEEEQLRAGRSADWRTWPARYRSPEEGAVAEVARRQARRVDFHCFLQFELDRQLAQAARSGRRAGLSLGLYQDLALGSAASGFDTWAFPELFLMDLHVGAPPDAYSATGQDWGFPPLSPWALAEQGYAYWLRLLRSTLAHSGAIRIDHVLGLRRQYWIPAGRPAREGAYVRAPAADLLGVLALESRRQGAVVIGEDLGTVPPELPALLARHGVLSSRVLLFEQDRSGRFRPAARYSRRALVTAHTHDHPPLLGFLAGRDLELRHAVGELDASALETARKRRRAEREALLARLRREGLLRGTARSPRTDADVSAAAYGFLAQTPCPLLGVSLDDLMGETEPINLPGVPPDRYPSWQRRSRLCLEDLPRSPLARAVLEAVGRRRSRR